MPDFGGMRVLALEARRGEEMATLIRNAGGEPTLAPALQEIPIEANPQAVAFAAALVRGRFELVCFLTGAGVRELMAVVAAQAPTGTEAFLDALRRVPVAARSPKPASALRGYRVEPTLTAPEPHTWRELLAALDAEPGLRLRGARVAVQEYGAPDPALAQALRERGAQVTTVPVYRWKLPDDLAPLRSAIDGLAARRFGALLLTNAVQVTHLFQVAAEAGQEEALRTGLQYTVIASVGPTTSEELARHGLKADCEPSRPRMGLLVHETARLSQELLARKIRGNPSGPAGVILEA